MAITVNANESYEKQHFAPAGADSYPSKPRGTRPALSIKMKTNIETSGEMRRFNRAVEAADEATSFRFDTEDALSLAWRLRMDTRLVNRFELAAELDLSAMDIPRETT